MRRTRDNGVDNALEQWRIERAAELQEEQRQRDAAQAAAAANDPVAIYAATANAEAEHNRQLVLSGVLSDEYLSQFGTIVRQPFTEAQVQVAMDQFMAETPDYIRTNSNAKVLIEFIWRNNISPAACDSYRIAHKLLTLWNGYPDLEKPVAQAEVIAPEVAEPVLTPSEQFKVNQANLDTVIAIVDGVEISERYLNSLPSRQELIIRRKLEKGHSGDSNFDEYLERRDVKFAMNQEIERKGAEEQQ